MSVDASTVRADYMEWLWANVGRYVEVRMEMAGQIVSLTGRVACHADGSYRIGPRHLGPQEGYPVQWALDR